MLRLMSIEFLQADARNLPLEDETVDLIITSPPYFGLRVYTDDGEEIPNQIGAEDEPDKFIQQLVAATVEMKRVLKPTGSIFVNLGDKYAGSGGHNNKNIGAEGRGPSNYPKGGARPKSLIGIPWRYAIQCIDQLDLILRSEIIWSKANGMPESVTDRTRRTHEHWFHLTKQGDYYHNLDTIREPHTTKTKINNPKGRIPNSVWHMPMEPLRLPKEITTGHHAAYPSEWPRKLILAWSPPGGTILDPFGGTGTTAIVAHHLGRHGISNDLSQDYANIANWRLTDKKLEHRIKTRSTPSTSPNTNKDKEQ